MIDKAIVKKNKQRLEKERVRVQKLLSRVTNADGTPKYPDFGNADDENATEVAEYEANIAEEADLEIKLKAVEAALQKIVDGQYGICAIGGEDIPVERLEVVPEAATCTVHA